MLDGEETVEIACGELRWEGARQHAGRRGNRGNSLRRASLGRSDIQHAGRRGNRGKRRERYNMLDGEETMEIACGELRREGARQHAGWKGNRGKSLRRASLGGSETACWKERKPWK